MNKPRIVACMPVRNESWVIGASLRALLMWADYVILLDHASEDGLPEILAGLPTFDRDRIAYLREDDPTWHEMRHRQRMLDAARQHGATHIVICDADEILSANLTGGVRERIAQLAPGELMQLPWPSMVTLDKYRDDGVALHQWVTMAFGDTPEFHWAARGEEQYDFHHRHPIGTDHGKIWQAVGRGDGGLMHLQFLSERRLRAKQALYKCIEVTRWPGRMSADELNEMYGLTVHGFNRNFPSEGKLTEAPAAWWDGYENLMQYIHVDAEPWHEREVKRLIQEHGAAKFVGLDLFGVA